MTKLEEFAKRNGYEGEEHAEDFSDGIRVFVREIRERAKRDNNCASFSPHSGCPCNSCLVSLHSAFNEIVEEFELEPKKI